MFYLKKYLPIYDNVIDFSLFLKIIYHRTIILHKRFYNFEEKFKHFFIFNLLNLYVEYEL